MLRGGGGQRADALPAGFTGLPHGELEGLASLGSKLRDLIKEGRDTEQRIAPLEELVALSDTVSALQARVASLAAELGEGTPAVGSGAAALVASAKQSVAEADALLAELNPNVNDGPEGPADKADDSESAFYINVPTRRQQCHSASLTEPPPGPSNRAPGLSLGSATSGDESGNEEEQ